MKILSAALLLAFALQGRAAKALDHSATADPCAAMPKLDVPQATISNGLVHALVYLPNAQTGYYRSTRFDWSGVIPCLSYEGHTYFEPWQATHNPLVADAISGPVEEFHPSDGGLGYAEAKVGGLFVKPGVGVLRKVSNAPYHFMYFYPIVKLGAWKVHVHKSTISFTQRLKSPIGYAYVYTKTLELPKGQPVLVLHHVMKNTGPRTIDMDVYDHDFYRLDNTPTGPAMSIHFAFDPKLETPFKDGGVLKGRTITYQHVLQGHESVQSVLTGYSNSPADYKFEVKNAKTGAGVEQTSDSPISYFHFWSVHTTIAPEAYIHIHIPPGGTQEWTIRYRFFVQKP